MKSFSQHVVGVDVVVAGCVEIAASEDVHRVANDDGRVASSGSGGALCADHVDLKGRHSV